MSDSGDFRGSREEKRQDETVMMDKDNMSNLVNEAKTDSTATPPATSGSAAGEDELADSQFGRILVILGIVALVIAVAIITYVNLIQQ